MKALLATLSIALSFLSAHAIPPRLDALQRHGLRNATCAPDSARMQRRVPAAQRPFVSKKAHFRVDGGALPLLNATLQDSYAGKIPIAANDTRSMFFWYWPSSAKRSDSLTIWLNGGSPGLQLLDGFLDRADAPSVNEFAWSRVSDMLYLDQPISTGFSSGEPDIVDEIGVANQFYGFLQQFYKVFPELLHKKLYIAGESYAGMYIPYIANRILAASTAEKAATPINLQSILINDGIYTNTVINELAPMADFVLARQQDMGIEDDEAVQEIVDNAYSDDCRLQGIMAQLVYPPKGPIYGDETTLPFGKCYARVVLGAFNAATDVNPCFSFYSIADKCPEQHDPIEEYFSRGDVQEALNVPGFGPWKQCGVEPFVDKDQSPYSSTIIPGLIDALPRGVTLWHGLDDFLLLSNGTRLTIQNMTWSGLQGFQTPITQQIVFDGAPSGLQHSERGLTYYEIKNAGHLIPKDRPSLALEVLKTVVGEGTGALVRS
ncbi:alpha/beta-hydrolase [Auricularia subglabra TFB-10046 SS5]|nr:alpha/beta-hydrolase [Auricularia subglabra TFB-10046 SS5]